MKSAAQIAWKLLVSGGVSLLLLGLLLRLVFHGVAPAERPALLEVLRTTSPAFVGLYFALALVQALFRALRYRLLIAADGGERAPGLLHTMLVTMVRNMCIDLLPARIGELSYVAMMNRGYQVRARTCLSSLGMSFVFDFVALFCIVAGLLGAQMLRGRLEGWLLSVALLLLLVAAGMLLFVFAGIRLGIVWARRLPGRFAEKKAVRRALEFAGELADAIDATRRAGVLGRTFALSLGVRLSKYLGLYCMFLAVAGASFRSMAVAPAVNVMSALLAAEGAANLPVPSFMSFGTYEAGGSLALTALGFAKAASLIAMLAIHLWSQAVDYLLGAAGFIAFLFLARRKAPRPVAPATAAARLWPAAALAVLCAGLAVCAMQYRSFRKGDSLRPPERGRPVAFREPEVRAALEAALSGQRGFVVWSSNREGNHDIYGISLPERRIVRLTTDPCGEYFPRISPDGRFVVFCRAHEPWVSQRSYALWDVHLLDLEAGTERLLAEKGNVPTWSADGTTVRFQREGNQFVEHELATGRERVLFQAGRGELPESAILETPAYSDARQILAVTLRKAYRATVLVDAAGAVRRVGGGCELAWSTDSSYLFYVDGGGRMKNAIYRVDPDSLKRSLLLDLAGDYSHEYFPKVSNDGRFLVLGASSGGHEHDRADYEIFLWRIGTPPESAVRLTYHTGNDCWPDAFIGSAALPF